MSRSCLIQTFKIKILCTEEEGHQQQFWGITLPFNGFNIVGSLSGMLSLRDRPSSKTLDSQVTSQTGHHLQAHLTNYLADLSQFYLVTAARYCCAGCRPFNSLVIFVEAVIRYRSGL